MARKFLSFRASRIRMALVLCALSARSRNRFDLLQRTGRERGPPLGRTDSGFVSLQLQTSARNHSRLPVTRLLRRIERVSPRDRATRIETPGCADPTAAIFHSQGWKTNPPQISYAAAERFPVCH